MQTVKQQVRLLDDWSVTRGHETEQVACNQTNTIENQQLRDEGALLWPMTVCTGNGDSQELKRVPTA